MPSIGDVKTLFGRTYVFANPNQALGPGTWLLSDEGGNLPGAGDDVTREIPVYGQAILANDSIPIIRGMLVYINNSGLASAAVASSLATAKVVGVAIDSANNGQLVQYTQNINFEFFNSNLIVDDGLTQLSVGDPYYLSTSNPGKWTLTPDTIPTGNVIIQCGTAVDPNYMSIDIQPLVVI